MPISETRLVKGGELGLGCLLNVRAAPVVRLVRERTQPAPFPHLDLGDPHEAHAHLAPLPRGRIIGEALASEGGWRSNTRNLFVPTLYAQRRDRSSRKP